ncbi:MAG: TIGR00725 family protein [Thermoplasmata archaeon]
MKLIGVLGGQEPAEEFLAMAEEVGYRIAQEGAAVICGGLSGVMEAACKGAKRGNGLTIGVLPTIRKGDANPHVDIVIASGMSTARNVIIVRSADALIAIDGSYGTLSEIAHAFEQRKPVVALGSWEMGNLGIPADLYRTAEDPREAVTLALALAENADDSSVPFRGST